MGGVAKKQQRRSTMAIVWDPDIALTHMIALPDNDELPFKDLSFKLVTLLAIITASRVQTLAALSLDSYQKKQDCFCFELDQPLKKSNMDRPNHEVHVPRFPSQPKLCAYSCLKEYLARTDSMRQ